MSLKTFHIVFMICTGLLTVFLTVWNYLNWTHYGEKISLLYMVISVACGIGVIIYGKRFLVKFKQFSFM